MTIGGSADVGVAVGGDLTVDLDTKEMGVSIGVSKSKSTGGNTGAGIKIGLGVSATAGEGHVRYNATQTKATSFNEIKTGVCSKLNSLKENAKNFLIEKTLEGLGY